jgi:hypothetical protein
MIDTTYTPDAQERLASYLDMHRLRHGVGNMESACTMAAINIALTGRVTDETPNCMSLVIGQWIIPVQDAMPLDRLNGPRWREAILRAPGTGRDPVTEQARASIVLDWMWGTVLPQVQPLADQRGFGDAWRRMCEDQTEEAAWAAWAAAAQAAEARASAAAIAAAEAAHGGAYDLVAFWDALDPETLLTRLIDAKPDQMPGRDG